MAKKNGPAQCVVRLNTYSLRRYLSKAGITNNQTLFVLRAKAKPNANRPINIKAKDLGSGT